LLVALAEGLVVVAGGTPKESRLGEEGAGVSLTFFVVDGAGKEKEDETEVLREWDRPCLAREAEEGRSLPNRKVSNWEHRHQDVFCMYTTHCKHTLCFSAASKSWPKRVVALAVAVSILRMMYVVRVGNNDSI
jgi:hypothetical protein